MIKAYRNSQGRMVNIAEMHDNHLWSAYRKYKTRLDRLSTALNKNKVSLDPALSRNKSKLTEMVDSFEAELQKRDLL